MLHDSPTKKLDRWIRVESDYEDQLTYEARAARQELLARHERYAPGAISPGLATPPSATVETVDDASWQLLETFAPWSINVDLEDATGSWVATFLDCGYSVTFDATTAEVASIRRAIPHIPLARLTDLGAWYADVGFVRWFANAKNLLGRPSLPRRRRGPAAAAGK